MLNDVKKYAVFYSLYMCICYTKKRVTAKLIKQSHAYLSTVLE